MIEIKPLTHCDATVTIPGSKSYTHRALLISALAEGETTLVNALRSEDTECTARGLGKLGIAVIAEGNSFRVRGTGGRLEAGSEEIYVGNSGTSMRFITALAALKTGRTVLDGNERMRKRPMAGLLQGLTALGARAESLRRNGYPPVVVESRGLRGGVAGIEGNESSQFFSALLMVAPYAREDVHLAVKGLLASRPYVDITRDVMLAFGIEVKPEGDGGVFVPAGQRYHAREYLVEGDASNASYFFSAAAVTRGRVRVENFRPISAQGDAGFLQILERMGCEVRRGETWAEVSGKDLEGITVDMNTMPDLVPTLAVTAAYARGKTIIRNIGHLRFKESDRI
ncbi:MAG: 3-phosphoshikimate 1-carboxyvinyltransferase, partial [Deltaproteobacteria bacterium]|nr:3-phosphoshikimate 1-carboxyvinyltransferase [Deltaproteobacteria bacterium]